MEGNNNELWKSLLAQFELTRQQKRYEFILSHAKHQKFEELLVQGKSVDPKCMYNLSSGPLRRQVGSTSDHISKPKAVHTKTFPYLVKDKTKVKCNSKRDSSPLPSRVQLPEIIPVTVSNDDSNDHDDDDDDSTDGPPAIKLSQDSNQLTIKMPEISMRPFAIGNVSYRFSYF